jgi:hypothetical protein
MEAKTKTIEELTKKIKLMQGRSTLTLLIWIETLSEQKLNTNEKPAKKQKLSQTTKPTTPDLQELQQQLTQAQQELSMNKWQLQNLQNPLVYQSDLKKLEMQNFKCRCREFSTTHLKMLRSLYNEELSTEHQQLFDQAKLFMSKCLDMIKLKLETEVSEIVCRRSLKSFSILVGE